MGGAGAISQSLLTMNYGPTELRKSVRDGPMHWPPWSSMDAISGDPWHMPQFSETEVVYAPAKNLDPLRAVVAYTFNPNTWEVEVEGTEVQDHPWLYGEFRVCLRRQQTTNKGERNRWWVGRYVRTRRFINGGEVRF